MILPEYLLIMGGSLEAISPFRNIIIKTSQEISMQIIPSLLFGISASLDALMIGIGYGIRGIRIRLWQNLVSRKQKEQGTG